MKKQDPRIQRTRQNIMNGFLNLTNIKNCSGFCRSVYYPDIEYDSNCACMAY